LIKLCRGDFPSGIIRTIQRNPGVPPLFLLDFEAYSWIVSIALEVHNDEYVQVFKIWDVVGKNQKDTTTKRARRLYSRYSDFYLEMCCLNIPTPSREIQPARFPRPSSERMVWHKPLEKTDSVINENDDLALSMIKNYSISATVSLLSRLQIGSFAAFHVKRGYARATLSAHRGSGIYREAFGVVIRPRA
jgi:hypothetical protein